MIAAAILCAFAGTPAGVERVEAPPTIVLRDVAEILGTSLELGEIAEIRAATPETARRLEALDLGPAPAPGATRAVKRDDVVRALRAAGLAGVPSGAPACRARPRVEILPGRDLEDAARNALMKSFAGRDIEIELVRPAADMPLIAPENRRDLDVDLGRRDLRPGAWSVPVDVRIDGVRAQTAWIALEVRMFERRPMAARDLRRGEPIDASSWTLERGLVDASAPLSPDPELLAGATCTRDLPRGTRITDLDVRRDPLVRSGDVVEIEVVRGGVRARSRAVARGQGALGDRVEVQSGESQRRLVGVVVARGLVRVELAVSPR